MKKRWTSRRAAALALLMSAVAMAGCGGGASSSTSRSAVSASAAFRQPKGPADKLVRFGREASPTEREAASTVLEKNLEARQKADFAVQCETLAAAGLREVIPDPKSKADTRRECPAKLRKLAEPLIDSDLVRADTMAGAVAVLRVKGDEGYALYHGKRHTDYAVPMSTEGGQWKVASLYTTKLGLTHAPR